jgi:hypothetical protein
VRQPALGADGRHEQLLSGGCMDLAMAMGLALFGMFAGSTVLFFYRIVR